MTTSETLPSESAHARASLENIDVLSLSSLSSSPYPEAVSLEDSGTQPRIPSSIPNSAEKHERFYFTDEHIQLLAGNKLFRVHAYLFERESEEARALIKRSWVNADRLVELDGIDSTDLERFCEVLYCRVSDTPNLSTKEEWTSVLQLAHLWHFKTLHALAMRELSTLTTCVDRIVFGRTYGAVAWLEGAYREVCEREDWLSDSEGRRLGLDDVLKIGSARAQLRYTGEFRSTCNGDRASMVKTFFKEMLDPSIRPITPTYLAGPSPPPLDPMSMPLPASEIDEKVATSSLISITTQRSTTVSFMSTPQPTAAHGQGVDQKGAPRADADPPFCSPVPDDVRVAIARLLYEISKSEDHQAQCKILLENLETKLNPEISRLRLRYEESPSSSRTRALMSVTESLEAPRRVLAEAERRTVKLHQDLSDKLFPVLVSPKPEIVSSTVRQSLADELAVLSQARQAFSDAQDVATTFTTKAQDRSTNEAHWSQIHTRTLTDDVVHALETAKRQSAFASEQKAKANRELEVAETKLAFAHLRFADLLNTLVKEAVNEASAAEAVDEKPSTTVTPHPTN